MKRLRAWGLVSFGLVTACGSDPARESVPPEEAESHELVELPVALASHVDLSTSRITVEEGELVVARDVAPPSPTESGDDVTRTVATVDETTGDAIDDGASTESALPSEDLRGRDQLRVGARAEDGVVMRLRNGSTLRVHEDGALGETRNVGGTASYAREGGRSYWTTGPEQGFEEWLEVAASDGRAPIARWRVDDHTFRTVPETGGVHVLDARGHAVAYVTAPEAWTLDGDAIALSLEVDGASLTLLADTQGERAILDPRWVPANSMMFARAARETANVTVTTSRGVMYVGGATSQIAEAYDPLTHVWNAAGTMVENRYDRYLVARLLDGRVFVHGGGSRRTTEIFDPGTLTWSAAASSTLSHSLGTATTLLDGRVLVVGGSNSPAPARSDVEIYDPATNTWSARAPIPGGRLWMTATLLADGRVVVAGGSTNSAVLSSVYAYTPATDSWASIGSLRTARCRQTATLLQDGRILFAHGNVGMTGTTAAEVLNVSTRAFTSVPAPTARDYQSATLALDGDVWVVGGARLSSTEIFDPDTLTWRAGPTLGRVRADHGDARLASGEILIIGGRDAGTATETAEILLSSDVCGNGVLDAGEQCDDGNNVNNDCCSSICRIDAAGTPCGWTGEACDAMEVCDGTTLVCPPDRLVAAGVACRDAVGDCDAIERCDGVTRACPADARLTGTVCRPSVGDCDVADTCDGSSISCDGDRAMTRGTACGPTPADPCDLVDTCSGTTGATAVCTRNVAAVGTSCRPTRGPCDPAEVCDGTAACPPDVTRADGTNCGDGLGCNGVETCTAGLCVSDGPIDCSDDDVCTLRACVEPGMCTTRSVVGCCNADGDCDDGNACTDDSCMVSGHACTYEPVDCDDGDACTVDACASDGSCTHETSSSCLDAATSDDGGVAPRDAGARIDASTTTPLDGGRANDVGATDATLDGSSPVPADAAASMTGGSGCGCRVERTTPSRLSWLVVALALAMARRRRRS